MSRVEIVAMRKNHISPVMDIESASFRNPWSSYAFMQEISNKNATGFVQLEQTEQSETPVAYLCARVFDDAVYILKVAVRPDMRNRGIATHLLKHCLHQTGTPDRAFAFLEVRSSNEAAVNLYRKLGFFIAGHRPGYYRDTGEDAMVMLKNIW